MPVLGQGNQQNGGSSGSRSRPQTSPFLAPQRLGADEVVYAPYTAWNPSRHELKKYPFRGLPDPAEIQRLKEHIRLKAEAEARDPGGHKRRRRNMRRKRTPGRRAKVAESASPAKKKRGAKKGFDYSASRTSGGDGEDDKENVGNSTASMAAAALASPRMEQPGRGPAIPMISPENSFLSEKMDSIMKGLHFSLQSSVSTLPSHLQPFVSTSLLRHSQRSTGKGRNEVVARQEANPFAIPFSGDHAVGARSKVNAHLRQEAVQRRPLTREEQSAQRWYRLASGRMLSKKGRKLGLQESIPEWLHLKVHSDMPDWFDRHHVTYRNDGKIITQREFFDLPRQIPDEQLDYVIRTRQNRYKFMPRPWTEGNGQFFPEPPPIVPTSRPTVQGAIHSQWQDVAANRPQTTPDIELGPLGKEVQEQRLLTALASREALDVIDPSLGKPSTAPANSRRGAGWREDFVRLESNKNWYLHSSTREYFSQDMPSISSLATTNGSTGTR
ncbi:unnamed protein product [Amoebophrya sp. A25]|nr:unnamed protein product [Amoebophrya sp. A25]|eukprot:GSA25T00017641001.1